MVYTNDQGRVIEGHFNAAYEAARTALAAGNTSQIKDEYEQRVMQGLESMVQGGNQAATINLIQDLGLFNKLDQAIATIRAQPGLSVPGKQAILGNVCDEILNKVQKAYGGEVPQPNEANRPQQNRVSLTDYRVEKYLETIRT